MPYGKQLQIDFGEKKNSMGGNTISLPQYSGQMVKNKGILHTMPII